MEVPDFRGGRGKKLRWVVAVLALGVVAAAIVWFTWPKRGQLTVTALAAGGRSVGRVQITVDGELRCEGAPCTIGELTQGDHQVRVTSTEFGNGERIVSIRPGVDHSVDVLLALPKQAAQPSATVSPPPPSATQTPAPVPERERPTAAPAKPERKAAITGTIKANSIPVSKVLIDGRPAGQTPTNIKVVPGSHTVTFVHPEYGKREVMVEVKPKQDAVVAVKLRSR